MKVPVLVLVIAFFTVNVGLCQNTYFQELPIQKKEMVLKQLTDSMMRGSSDRVRMAATSEFNVYLSDLLKDPESYTYPFDSIKPLSKLRSKDGSIRIYTWFQPSREDGSYRYYGMIQRYNSAKKELKTIGLSEVKTDSDTIETKEMRSEAWLGAVYYDLIEQKLNKKTVFYLLGWQGNDRFTSRKIIEVLSFDQWDNVTFGAPVFTDEKGKKKYREVFEFTSEAVMLLRYLPKKKMFVFDHLSPASGMARGQYRYYGPDFTYDGYRLKKGLWYYKSNLDLRNEDRKK